MFHIAVYTYVCSSLGFIGRLLMIDGCQKVHCLHPYRNTFLSYISLKLLHGMSIDEFVSVIHLTLNLFPLNDTLKLSTTMICVIHVHLTTCMLQSFNKSFGTYTLNMVLYIARVTEITCVK